MYKGYITDIKGIEVGHAHDEKGLTGCTFLSFKDGVVAGAHARGTVRGRRNVEDITPKMSAEKIVGLMLAGGGAFGLESMSAGIHELSLTDIKTGFAIDTVDGKVVIPFATGATIFDLNIGDPKCRPTYEMGEEAMKNLSVEENRQGNVGVGMGASIGKLLGNEYAMKGGLGSATVEKGDLKVSALVVVNSSGDIYDIETGKQIAGSYDYENGKLLNSLEGFIENGGAKKNFSGTIGVIATNARLSKSFAARVADMAHNGLVKTISPINTSSDGDVVYTLSTEEIEADYSLVGLLAEEALSKAVMNAIKSAETVDGIKACKDI